MDIKTNSNKEIDERQNELQAHKYQIQIYKQRLTAACSNSNRIEHCLASLEQVEDEIDIQLKQLVRKRNQS